MSADVKWWPCEEEIIFWAVRWRVISAAADGLIRPTPRLRRVGLTRTVLIPKTIRLISTCRAPAVPRFLGKASKGCKDWERLSVINTDKTASYRLTVATVKRKGRHSPDRLHQR